MNRIASVVLFDVGCRKLSTEDDSFFAQSKRCLSRLILRKMYSEDSDEMGVVLFGSDRTENCMPERERDKYESICELGCFGKSSFKLYENVESIKQCKGYKSDWVQGLIVALEYLRKGVQGKRFKLKQLVVFSQFPTRLEYSDSYLSTLVSCMKDLNVNLTVVCPDLPDESDEIPRSFQTVMKFLELIDDPLKLSIDELVGSIKYFEKKRKTRRVFNVDLEIGSDIKIPVGWVKLTSENQRFSNWVSKEYLNRKERVEGDSSDGEDLNEGGTHMSDQHKESFRSEERSDYMELESNSSKLSAEDVFKVTKFGKTQITFSMADLNTLKRESGPPSFKILFFTSRSLVNPTMYVGEDIFAVIPRDKSNYSQVKLYALIDALKEEEKVAIARRIVMKNGKIQLGVLLPLSDECGKQLYFLKLPTAEWAQPFPRHRENPLINQAVKDSFKKLINLMRLPDDLLEEGQGLLVPNPHFQLRCQLFSDRASNPNCDIAELPDYIKKIVDPFPEFKEATESVTSDIVKALPSLNSILRKEDTSDRAEARAATKAHRSSKPNYSVDVKKKQNDTSRTSDTSFATAQSTDSIQEQTDVTLKQEIKIEEDVHDFYGLLGKLAKNMDATYNEMLDTVE